MTKRNMKIPVENNLDEIVVELERIGFSVDRGCSRKINYIFTEELKAYCFHTNLNDDIKTTTLVELRSMKIETLKEMDEELLMDGWECDFDQYDDFEPDDIRDYL